MDVPTKMRLLIRLGKIAPEWSLKWQASVIEHAFDSELAAAKGAEARESVVMQRDLEAGEYWNALAALRSRRLVDRAQKLYVPLDGLKWDTDQYANRFLDNPSEAKLYRAIREEKRRAWDFRIKVIGALTGLIGTVIGLVAIWKR
jgi:hypothetical protein